MTTAIALSNKHGPARRAGRWLVLVGAALVLIAFGARLSSAPVEGAPPPSASTNVASAPPASMAPSGCWITGDLVGEGNPADLAALCASK